MGIKLVWWTWHDTDPNIYDRHYWVPWTSYYFHATFACSLNILFHGSRKLFTNTKGYKADRYLLPPASEGWEKVIFSVCLSVHTGGGGLPPSADGGGYPHQVLTRGYSHPSQLGGGTPSFPSGQNWMGETPPTVRTGWDTPLSQIGRESNYAAGGMPLAFTQENFLVSILVHRKQFCPSITYLSSEDLFQFLEGDHMLYYSSIIFISHGSSTVCTNLSPIA